jgi:cytochrome c-type biogenesis protein CcmF
VNQIGGPDYTATRADMRLLRDGSEIALLHPEKRFYPVENGNATGVAIRTNLLSDVYAVIGDPDGKGGYTLRLYWNPLVPWIWLGAAAMALGGLVSLTDRRHRVGAPARRSRGRAAITVQAAE